MARPLNDNPPVPLTASMPYRLRQEVVELARAEQRSAASMPPGTDDCGQTRNRPHRHAAAAVTLQAIIQPDQRRPGGVA